MERNGECTLKMRVLLKLPNTWKSIVTTAHNIFRAQASNNISNKSRNVKSFKRNRQHKGNIPNEKLTNQDISQWHCVSTVHYIFRAEREKGSNNQSTARRNKHRMKRRAQRARDILSMFLQCLFIYYSNLYN